MRHEGEPPGRLLRSQVAVADRIVLSKIRALFGGELQLAVTGAAPIAIDVLHFFDAAGIRIREAWGMTETTAAGTLNTVGDYRFGTVGRALPGVELAIAEDGEVRIKGPNVMAGYFKGRGGDTGSSSRRLVEHRRPRLADRRLPVDHRPQEGHHHHLERQEHHAGQRRELES